MTVPAAWLASLGMSTLLDDWVIRWPFVFNLDRCLESIAAVSVSLDGACCVTHLRPPGERLSGSSTGAPELNTGTTEHNALIHHHWVCTFVVFTFSDGVDNSRNYKPCEAI